MARCRGGGKTAVLAQGAGWERAFDGFRGLGEVVVGETRENLARLFQAVLSADVVVAGAPRQHNLTYQLLANSAADASGPVLLLLHKPAGAGDAAWLRETFPRPENVVPVNVRAPDFEAIGNALRRVGERPLPSGAGGAPGRGGKRGAGRGARRGAGRTPEAPRIWLASYPRSGNTLLRTILNQCFGLRTTSLYPRDLGHRAELERVTGHYERSASAAPPAGQPELVKTHGRPRDGAPAIYVVRDGRAVAVSVRVWFSRDAAPSLREVIAGVHAFGLWREHVETWAPWSRPDTLLVRYEDMTTNLPAVLEALGNFLDRPVLSRRIPERRELAAIGGRWIRNSSDWRDEVTPADMRLFRLLNRAVMERLGYPLEDAAAWEARPPGWHPMALLGQVEIRYWRHRRERYLRRGGRGRGKPQRRRNSAGRADA